MKKERLLLPFIRRNTPWFLLAIVLMALLSLARAQGTTYISAVTREIQGGSFAGVLRFVALAILLQGAFYILRWTVSAICKRIDEKLAFELRTRLTAHLSRIPLAVFERFSTGDLQSIVRTDTANAGVTIYIIFSRMLSNVFITIVTAWYMIALDAAGAAIVLGISILLGIVNHMINKRVRAYELAARQAQGRVSQVIPQMP